MAIDIRKLFDKYFLDKKVLLLGFGREGKSAYRFLKKHYPENKLGIADRQVATLPEFDSFTKLHCGDNYLNSLIDYDVVLKSPGISLPEHFRHNPSFVLTSQTEIFLNVFHNQIIGITGTKGKSTTASLIYHLLKTANKPALLGGNIGKPVFELIEEVAAETIITLELSSHQLQYINTSPAVAILLNIYPEHLDYYRSFEEYKQAKMNITHYQSSRNDLIYPLTEFLSINTNAVKYGFLITDTKDKSATVKFKTKDGWLETPIDRTRVKLPGDHNLINIGAAIIALLQVGCRFDEFMEGVYSFQGLKHRLQEFAQIENIRFINDSISTIPETTIAALKVYNRTVESLIVGGHSRGDGISFKKLAEEILTSQIDNLFLLPETGNKVFDDLISHGANADKNKTEEYTKIVYQNHKIRVFFVNDFVSIIKLVYKYTARGKTGKICLLSPAATSYNNFKNFEERGDAFINAVSSYSKQ